MILVDGTRSSNVMRKDKPVSEIAKAVAKAAKVLEKELKQSPLPKIPENSETESPT